MKSWRITTAIAALLGLGTLMAPAMAAGQAGTESAQIGRPGDVNYVEGVASLDGNPLKQKDVGTASMEAGQELRTSEGKVEILLNPGIYLRMDSNSVVKMISPSLTPTIVELRHGHASVEVDQLLKENVVQIVDNGVTTQLVKNGYYEFNANSPMARVFKGQAEVQYSPKNWEEIKGGHELALLPNTHEKARTFHPDLAEDPLMAWSKLRSQYLAEANNQIASEYYGDGYGPGWYWDQWNPGYTFLGMSPFYSPFGWGFYPMGWGWGGMGMGMGMGMGWGGGWGWDGWGMGPGGGFGDETTTTTEVRLSHLVLDMFDTKSKALMWRGVSRGELSDKSGKNREQLYKDVHVMFRDFPPKNK